MDHARGQEKKLGSPRLSGAAWLSFVAVSVAVPLIFSAPAKAALIASDNFVVGGTGYTSGSLAGKGTTVGTTGYQSASTWYAGTGAFDASAITLSSPLVVSNSQTSTPAGVMQAFGLGSTSTRRWQYRQLATFTTSSTYYFSELLQASTLPTSTEVAYAGLSAYGAGITTNFSGGVQLGFSSAGLQVLYYTGSSGTTQNSTVLVASPTAGDTYMGYVSMVPTTGAITVDIYDGSTEVATTTITGTPASLAAAKLGSFAAESGFYPTSSATGISFTDLRFGTAQSDVVNLPTVPEPASCALLLLGGAPLLLKRRRRI